MKSLLKENFAALIVGALIVLILALWAATGENELLVIVSSLVLVFAALLRPASKPASNLQAESVNIENVDLNKKE
jgi:hypothetical protein